MSISHRVLRQLLKQHNILNHTKNIKYRSPQHAPTCAWTVFQCISPLIPCHRECHISNPITPYYSFLLYLSNIYVKLNTGSFIAYIRSQWKCDTRNEMHCCCCCCVVRKSGRCFSVLLPFVCSTSVQRNIAIYPTNGLAKKYTKHASTRDWMWMVLCFCVSIYAVRSPTEKALCQWRVFVSPSAAIYFIGLYIMWHQPITSIFFKLIYVTGITIFFTFTHLLLLTSKLKSKYINVIVVK